MEEIRLTIKSVNSIWFWCGFNRSYPCCAVSWNLSFLTFWPWWPDMQTHPLPDVFDLSSYNAALGVLVSHPVLSAAVDDTTARTLQNIAGWEKQREMARFKNRKRCICASLCADTHPDQAYLANPNHGLSVEADVLGTTITSLPPS